MFDIGFSELFVVAIVALLVLGPERLPRAARFTGLWVRRARAQWYSVKTELESELADDELKRSLARTRDEFRDISDDLRREGADIVKATKAPATSAATSGAISAESGEQSAPVEPNAGATDETPTGVFLPAPPAPTQDPDTEHTPGAPS